MEDITLKHQNFLNAYSRLEQVIKRFDTISKNDKYDLEDVIAYRDSVIKRFEFCYDLFWKLLKSYLELQYQLAIASPKKVFHACFENNIINEDDTRQLLNMADEGIFLIEKSWCYLVDTFRNNIQCNVKLHIIKTLYTTFKIELIACL